MHTLAFATLLIAAEPASPGWGELRQPKPDARLSPAEAEVMQWLAEGKTNVEIAALRGRSLATVRNQLHSAFRKLGARTRGQAVAIWLAKPSTGACPAPPARPFDPPGERKP